MIRSPLWQIATDIFNNIQSQHNIESHNLTAKDHMISLMTIK